MRMHSPRRRREKLAAFDSTGFESHHCSRHFVKRRSRVENLWQTPIYKRFPKLTIVCDASTHLVFAIHFARDPASDVAQRTEPVARARSHPTIGTLVANAGYDSESHHPFCRVERGIRTLIPPLYRRPTTKPVRGRCRRLMQTRFDNSKYVQRWQSGT